MAEITVSAIYFQPLKPNEPYRFTVKRGSGVISRCSHDATALASERREYIEAKRAEGHDVIDRAHP